MNLEKDILSEFNQLSVNNLLDLMNNPRIREGILDLFCGMNSDLFSPEQEILRVFEDIVGLFEEGKPLYNRWTKVDENKKRILSVPKKPLRDFFENYLINLIKTQEPHLCCHGGEKGWSPRRSLETHLPCSSMFSFDLFNASENMDVSYVFQFFHGLLENFSDEIRRDLSELFSFLCTVKYDDKRGLPQGSPHSMALFNRVFYSLDVILHEGAQTRNFTYSRWVDDMNISSCDVQGIESFLGAAEIVSEIFPLSPEKLFFQSEPNDIFSLGQVISNGYSLRKNTKEEKITHKCDSLPISKYFGDSRIYDYDSWK